MYTRLPVIVMFSAILALVGVAKADEYTTDEAANDATGVGQRNTSLAPGDVLNRENWQLAEGLLPPEMLKHYRDGDFENRILEWPNGIYRWKDDFVAATGTNRGKFTLNAEGTIVEETSGEQPPYIYGFPFPDIDPDDPQVGAKILWNAYYGFWYLGSIRSETQLTWVNPDGVDREAGQEIHFLYYDGQPTRYRMPNPNNFLMQFISVTTYPADLHGTTALTWRYRDSTKRDSNWAYVPALRRVRAVSPSNRSDGALGSDLSLDDGPFFDGKPEDFDWKLVDAREQLRLVDPLSLEGKSTLVWLADGGWRPMWPRELKTVGYHDAQWKGLAWAPIGPQLAKRPMWILEATPKDKYYLYGKIQLYIDQETYQGAYNRKFSWKGELLNTYYVLGWLPHRAVRPDGGEEWPWGSNMGYLTAENVKLNRATVTAQLPPGKDPANDRRVPYESSFFDFTTLQRFGK